MFRPSKLCYSLDVSVQLPADILTEILLKLPVKSILRFKSVCKYWHSIINDTHFTKRHLKLALSAPNRHSNFFTLCLHLPTPESPILLHQHNTDGTLHTKPFDIPQKYLFHKCSNSCNGLLCFYGIVDCERIFVWNPCLATQVKIIPSPPFSEDEIALGFDPNSDDYKIVKVPSLCLYKDKYVRVQTFSFKANSWKSKRFSTSCPLSYSVSQALVYANNRVHWFATERDEGGNRSKRIMYFDLVVESLKLMNLPPNSPPSLNLINYKDSIAVVSGGHLLTVECWVLENYCGMKTSWKKIFRIATSISGSSLRIGVTLDGTIFVRARDDGLRMFDPNNERLVQGTDFPYISKCACPFLPFLYVQTLLSPRHL